MNRFKIPEPKKTQGNLLRPEIIDAVLVPLVAFDQHGNRLGMGGGYYDRMLKKLSAQCLIIGIAYDFQYTETLPAEAWDMPMTEVITPSNHYTFKNS